MQLISKTLPPSHRIVLAGDLHLGTIAYHEKGWLKLVKRVMEEEDLYIALGGDLVESILVDDKRFQASTHDPKVPPMAQMDWVKSDLALIKDKILFILNGNHELKLMKYGDLTKRMCMGDQYIDRAETEGRTVVDKGLGVPYGGFSTKLSVYVSEHKKRKFCYKLFYTHGRLTVKSVADDPIRRRANMSIQVKRKLFPLCGDAVIMATAHCHQLIAVPPNHELYMTDDGVDILGNYTRGMQTGNFIPPNLRWYVSTGSFLKSQILGATTYSEAAMYPPSDLGYAIVHCEDKKITNIEEVFIGTA